MSELISGKEALIALANGERVQYSITNKNEWHDKILNITLYYFIGDGVGQFQFRIKPRTITINGIEVPAPFKPKHGQKFYYLNDEYGDGFSYWTEYDNFKHVAVWETEEEIKKVVEALRSIFKC